LSSVKEFHTFFWHTKLSDKRMQKISDWIGSLTLEEKRYLDDLLSDYRDELEWECNYDYNE
jgi:hypothetical protein